MLAKGYDLDSLGIDSVEDQKLDYIVNWVLNLMIFVVFNLVLYKKIKEYKEIAERENFP